MDRFRCHRNSRRKCDRASGASCVGVTQQFGKLDNDGVQREVVRIYGDRVGDAGGGNGEPRSDCRGVLNCAKSGQGTELH